MFVLFIITAIIISIYYLVVFLCLVMGDFEKRNTFLKSLIPFGGLVIIIINAYKQMEPEPSTKKTKEKT